MAFAQGHRFLHLHFVGLDHEMLPILLFESRSAGYHWLARLSYLEWAADDALFSKSNAKLFEELVDTMGPAEIRDEIIDILSDIAPDEDLSNLKDDVSFRDQLELDSMDFLDIVMELRKRYRIQVPEEEYPQLASMASTVKYLEPKMADL